MDYYEEKLKKSGGSMRSCCFSLLILAITLVLCMFCSCKSVKNCEKESTLESDSTRTEYTEKVVNKPVKVAVDVPEEKKERETPDTTSFLETKFALSTASIKWQNGIPFLYHMLENKPQKIEKTDSVPVVEKEKTVWKTRRVTYNKTEIREKQISGWQTFLMWSGGIGWIIVIFFFIVKLGKHR